MDAWQLVIQQLEGLTTEIEALSQFLDVLDEDYVSAEPAGDRSIRSIFQQINHSDRSFLQILSPVSQSTPKIDEADFAGLLSKVKTGRLELLEQLGKESDPKREVVVEDQSVNIIELARKIAISNSGDLREIAYRLHSSQQIFSNR